MTWMVRLSPVPNQTLRVTLGSQNAQLFVYQRSVGLFVDVHVDDALIIGGVIAHDRCRIVRDGYLGFAGDLGFVDQQSMDDPYYSGLGSRWVLFWYPPEEIPA